MNDGEQALLRRALIAALTLSALSAPASFAGVPAPIAPGWAVLHSAVLAALAIALWRRWVTPSFTAAAAGLMAGASAFVVARAMAAVVAAGNAPAAGLALVSLTAVIGAGGVVFLAVRSRLAVIVGLVVLASQVLAIVLGAAAAWRTVLLAPPVIVALRFGVVAIVLFGLVSAIAERRGAQLDAVSLERELAEARATIERDRAALRDRVLSEAAHELKTPLTVIRGSLDLLLRHDALPAEQRTSLEGGLWRALAKLEQRTQSVLSAGTAPVSPPPLPLGTPPAPVPPQHLRTLVDRARASCPPAVADRVVSDVPDVLVAVLQSDADHVLENLLSNAWKYGSVDSPITISAEVDGSTTRLIVHDHGTALSPHEAERVFERGFRAASTMAMSEGSGVGLSLVARLVEGWGGSSGCEVAADGTRVWVTMPLAAALTA